MEFMRVCQTHVLQVASSQKEVLVLFKWGQEEQFVLLKGGNNLVQILGLSVVKGFAIDQDQLLLIEAGAQEGLER